MAKQAKAFQNLDKKDLSKSFKPKAPIKSGYPQNKVWGNDNKPKPQYKSDFKPKVNKPFIPKDVTPFNKKLLTIFMQSKGSTLLFKIFINKDNVKLPVFTKLLLKNDGSNTEDKTSGFKFYLVDANSVTNSQELNTDFEIVGATFFADSNIKFKLKCGSEVTGEQIISKKLVEKLFLQSIMGRTFTEEKETKR